MERKALLDYWRSCLADSEQQSPKVDPLFFPEPKALRKGQISAEAVDKIFDEVRRRDEAKRKKSPGRKKGVAGPPDEWRRPPFVSLLIAPFRLKIRVEHGERKRAQSKGKDTHYPLWIPVRMNPEGKLEGEPEHSAWIGRKYLAPSGTERLTLGELDAADEFRSAFAAPPEPWTWDLSVGYAERLLEAVTQHGDLWTYGTPETVTVAPVAVLADDQVRAAKYILQLYDQLRDQPTLCSPAWTRLVGDAAIPEPAELEALLANAGDRPLGHTSAAFGLQPSQRKALLAGLSLEDGQTLAIKGPPGTGKTTLIQSLVASLWVEGALAGGEPPVIHACTSNNRAFENILETFQRSLGGAEPGNPFAERWTPGPQGYGLAMPSQHAAGKHREKGFPLALRGYPSWQELPAISHDKEAVNDGARHYLEAARRALGKGEARTLEGVVETLHGLLKQVHSQGGEIVARSVRSHHAREATGLPEHREYLRALEDRRTALDHEIPDLRRLVSEIDEAITSVTFWEDLLAFLPPIRARRDDKVLGPFRRRGWECLPELGGSAYREVARTAAAEALSEAREERLRIEVRMAEEHELVQRISALSQWLPYGGEEADVPGLVRRALDSEMELEHLLDRTLRRRLFHLAARYWEGRWLREVLALHDSDPDFGRRQGQAACRQRFRRFAKLTPISVSTFFMLPRLFDYFDPEAGEGRPLTECLDLLIVDEAGQTLSEVGAPALQYAKRAVVVGDRYQIEPIWGIDRVLDRANQKRAGIDLEGSKGDAFRCSGEGSLMLLAERASRLGEEDGSPGIMLTEHWRCRPEIIEYCNQLVYGRLEPKRSPASDPYLPCFGWAHLAHRAQKRRGSWVNPGHAWAIAEWLHRRRSELEEQYGALANIGIVTPFRPQAIEIGRALRDFDLKTIEVGTVHTFQGGEKDLVLFSPTYSADSPPNYFFDITPNMLNVAVSRARESFLVFGDMSIFRPPVAGQGAGTPSGLLAKFLFARPEQEITDVESVPPPPDRARAHRIDTLEGHRQHLRRAFGEVRERLLVVSPYLTSKAVEADEVPALIRHARNRQVRVVVAYCRDLQQEDRAKEAKTWLEEAGAEVLALDRIHQKSLAVDDRWIVEGSFNWLSASRNPDSRYHRAEASMLCHAPDAVEMIDRVWTLVETRRGGL